MSVIGAVFLALALAGASQPPSPSPRPEPEEGLEQGEQRQSPPEEAHHAPPEALASTLRPNVSENSPEGGRDDEEREASENSWHEFTDSDWPLTIVTFILAVITGLLAVFTYRLWGATKRTAQQAKRSSETSLRAYIGPAELKLYGLEGDHLTCPQSPYQ